MTNNHLNKAALLIGVSEYDSSFKSLPQVKNNIRDLHEILSNPHLGGYTIDDEYRNENSTANDLETTINEFLKKNEGNSILIYYAGHGLVGPNDIFLLTARDSEIYENGTPKHTTFVTSASIIDSIRFNKFKELVLILDCCHAGAFIEDFKNSVEKNPTLQKRNYTILASCNAYKKIYLQNGSDHSPFVESFIKRINDRGKNDSISINANDLFNYTSTHSGYLKPQKLVSESSENSPPTIFNIKTDKIEVEIFKDKISVNENHRKSEDVKKLAIRYSKVRKLFGKSEIEKNVGSYNQDIGELQNIIKKIAHQKKFKSKNERKTFIEEISKELKLELTHSSTKYKVSIFRETSKNYFDEGSNEVFSIIIPTVKDVFQPINRVLQTFSKKSPKSEIKYNALRSISVLSFSVIFFSGKDVLTPQNQPHIYSGKPSSKKNIFSNTSVLSIAVSPDSRNMIILSRDGKLKNLNLDNRFSHDLPGGKGEKIELASYTSTGNIQVISTDKTNIKIHKSNEKNTLKIPVKGEVSDYVFSTDDKTLVTISKTSGAIKVFSLTTGKEETKANFVTQMREINNVIIKDEFIILAGEQRLDKACEKNSEDGCLGEASSGKGSIEIFDWKKNQLIIENNDHSNKVTAMAISGNGNILISSSAAGQVGGEIRVWNLAHSIKSQKLISNFEGVQSTNAVLSSIATNNEGDIMAVSSAEDKIQTRLTSSKDGNIEIINSDSNQVNSLALNLKGDMLFSSDSTGEIIQYKLEKNIKLLD
jgi:Caspase domain